MQAQTAVPIKKANDSVRPQFHVITSAGLLAGASDRDFLWQSTIGFQYKTWFVGAGSGMDYYYLRSVPIFIEVRKHFQNPIPFYVYADAGVNLPAQQAKFKESNWFKSRFKKGVYYDVGAGYPLALNKRNVLLLSIGYTKKTYTETQTEQLDVPYPTHNTLDYNLRRLVFKVGFQW
ncbi:MAG TPA: hypothetical protein VM010_02285 [Chitinophagaceae bacterium]|nr:hypothetical protein [Chitinophagaceae bacterium]